MAKRMAAARLYSFPHHYDPKRHPSPRNIRHGIGVYLHREWRLKTEADDEAKKKRGERVESRHPHSWYAFCNAVGWVPWTGFITNLKLKEA